MGVGAVRFATECWSYLVRDTLLWLDEADPFETMKFSRAKCLKLDAPTAVLAQWCEVIRTNASLCATSSSALSRPAHRMMGARSSLR
jgi:hypothetical protein